MIFMSTTSTTICRGALQRKSNVAVTFTDAQSDSSFVVVYHMLGRANSTGQEPRAIVEFLKFSNNVTLIEEVKSNNATPASD
jgi:hypothetical protein